MSARSLGSRCPSVPSLPLPLPRPPQTDGADAANFEAYFGQAAALPNRPALVGLTLGGRRAGRRLAVLEHLEAHGLPALYLPEADVQAVADAAPDSFGLTEAELAALAPLVRNYKCQGQLEHGDPYCGLERWSPICPERRFKTSWHPGW